MWTLDQRFEPQFSEDERADRYDGWLQARSFTTSLAQPHPAETQRMTPLHFRPMPWGLL